MIYRVEYLASVVHEDIPKLTKAVRHQVKMAIEAKLTSHPIEFGKPLRYSLRGPGASGSETGGSSTRSKRRTWSWS